MNSNALDQLSSEVTHPSARSSAPAPVERTEVFQARRVTENDWRLTLEATPSLAGRLEAVVLAAPDAVQGTCRTEDRPGRHHVRLEIGCRGPHLVASLLEAVVDDHTSTPPNMGLQAQLQVDDSMRPRRIDLLAQSDLVAPPGAQPHYGMPLGMLGLVPAQPV